MEDKEVDDLISGYEDSQGCVNYEGKFEYCVTMVTSVLFT